MSIYWLYSSNVSQRLSLLVLLLLQLLLFNCSVNTEAKKSTNGHNGVSFSDHNVLEGNCIPSSNSYGQKQDWCVL